MKEYKAVFSISLSEGFANIDFNDKGDMTVAFLNDEGYSEEDKEYAMVDIQKVAHFIDEMKKLKLEQFQS